MNVTWRAEASPFRGSAASLFAFLKESPIQGRQPEWAGSEIDLDLALLLPTTLLSYHQSIQHREGPDPEPLPAGTTSLFHYQSRHSTTTTEPTTCISPEPAQLCRDR